MFQSVGLFYNIRLLEQLLPVHSNKECSFKYFHISAVATPGIKKSTSKTAADHVFVLQIFTVSSTCQPWNKVRGELRKPMIKINVLSTLSKLCKGCFRNIKMKRKASNCLALCPEILPKGGKTWTARLQW